MNYPFIFPNFTILFLFLYLFLLIPSVLKKMYTMHGNTQVTMTKKNYNCHQVWKNVSYSSNSTLAPCPHQSWLSTLQESYVLSRSAIPPSTYLPLSLFFLSLQIQSIQRDTLFKGRITFRNVWSYKSNQKRNFHWIFKTRR